MATIAAAAIVAGGAAYAASASSKSAGKQQGMIDEQMEEARRIRAENKGIAEGAYSDIDKLISGMPGIEGFLEQAGGIASSQRKDRLDFILGDSQGDIRKAQGIQASLAAFDFSGIGANLSKILESNTFDIASITRDSASGSFANMSVANIASLAQQGINNSINLGDFIGRISGIDDYTPYRIAQDLFTVEQGRVNSRIQNVTNRADTITGVNNDWFNNYADLNNASRVVEATKTAAQISAVNTATSSIAGMVGGIPAANAQNAQTDYYKQLMGKYQP